MTVFLTMNTPLDAFEEGMRSAMEAYFGPFHFLNGSVEIIPVCDTLQVDDYSQYEMNSFSEEHKKAVHDHDFPAALQTAYQIGMR